MHIRVLLGRNPEANAESRVNSLNKDHVGGVKDEYVILGALKSSLPATAVSADLSCALPNELELPCGQFRCAVQASSSQSVLSRPFYPTLLHLDLFFFYWHSRSDVISAHPQKINRALTY
jgi:hypothetical protein